MKDRDPIDRRKLEHIRIVLEEEVEPCPSPFERYRLPYRAMPELDLAAVDARTEFLGKPLSFPFLIGSMTGGPARAATINRNLAIAAESVGVGLGLGSMRVAVRKPETAKSFQVRDLCRSVPLLANLGLVQLNYGFGADEINRLIDLVEADGVFFHVNPLQEAIQPHGDTDFSGLFGKLERILPKIKAPILIKEVGCGIDAETARRFAELGVRWIDVAGTGGTSWPWVEGYRREDRLGRLFRGIGVPTDRALIDAAKIPDLNLIAGGGVRSGLDIAKSIMLGARLATAAKPFLAPALKSPEACIERLRQWKQELEIAMFCVAAHDLAALARVKLDQA